MIETAQGLVLRTRPLTDTSLIVHWLTPGFGRLATVAKGARRAKSTYAGKLDLFYAADFSFQRSRSSDLHQLREVVLREPHARLRTDLRYVQQAAYAALLIEQTTERETPLPEIHDLFAGFLAYLPGQPPRALSVFAWELRLLRELGLEPDGEAEGLGELRLAWLHRLLESDWAELAAAPPEDQHLLGLGAFLRGFLLHHLGKVPAARAAALP